MKKLFSFLILIQAILLMSCGGHKEIANSDPSGFCIPDSLMLNITLDTVKTEYVMSDLKLSGKISFNEDECCKSFSAGKRSRWRRKGFSGRFCTKGTTPCNDPELRYGKLF